MPGRLTDDANSNSATAAVAQISAKVSGGEKPEKPEGLLPGWSVSDRVSIDKTKLCSDPEVKCKR